MTRSEYIGLLDRCGLRYVDVAWMCGVNVRTTFRWSDKSEKWPVPQSVALLLQAYDEGLISPRWVVRHVETPVP